MPWLRVIKAAVVALMMVAATIAWGDGCGEAKDHGSETTGEANPEKQWPADLVVLDFLASIRLPTMPRPRYQSSDRSAPQTDRSRSLSRKYCGEKYDNTSNSR